MLDFDDSEMEVEISSKCKRVRLEQDENFAENEVGIESVHDFSRNPLKRRAVFRTFGSCIERESTEPDESAIFHTSNQVQTQDEDVSTQLLLSQKCEENRILKRAVMVDSPVLMIQAYLLLFVSRFRIHVYEQLQQKMLIFSLLFKKP